MPFTTSSRNHFCTSSFLWEGKDSGYNSEIISTNFSNASFSRLFSFVNCAISSDASSSDASSCFVCEQNLFKNRSSTYGQLGLVIAD